MAVGQGGIRQWEDDANVLVILMSSSGSEINGRPYHVCCGSAGQVVSSRDPFHVMHLEIPTPSNMIGGNTFEAKENETPPSPRFELVCHQTSDVNLKSNL